MEDNFDLQPTNESGFSDDFEHTVEISCSSICHVEDIGKMESRVKDDNSLWGRLKSFFGFSKK